MLNEPLVDWAWGGSVLLRKISQLTCATDPKGCSPKCLRCPFPGGFDPRTDRFLAPPLAHRRHPLPAIPVRLRPCPVAVRKRPDACCTEPHWEPQWSDSGRSRRYEASLSGSTGPSAQTQTRCFSSHLPGSI